MLVHRENSLLPSSGGDPSFGAAYSVTAYPVGARASQASSGSTATTDAGHSFRVGDKALIRPGSDNVFTAAITAVTSTTIAWGAESYSVYAGDQIVNMGPDTGTTSPNYNGSPMAIYRDGDGTTQETYATVTSSSVGEYAYWHKGDGRFWELLRDGDGVVTGAVAGFGGDPNRYNVCDYGAAGDGTTDDATRIQAAIDNAEVVNGNVYLPEGTFMHSATLTISERIKFSGAGGGDYDGDDQAATIIKKSADVTSILVEDGAHYTVLEDFLVVAILSGDTTSGVEIGEATATNGVTGCELRRVNAQGLGGFGFDVRNGNAGIMDSVQASSNNSHGISLDSDASTDNVNAWTLLNCHGSGNGGDGLYLGTAKVITVIGGDFESNIGRGIYVGSNRNYIRSYAENNTGYDLEVGASAHGGWFNVRTGAVATKVLLSTDKCIFVDQTGSNYGRLQAYEFVAKGRPDYNVMAYGAVADGVTDDSAAIQAAIDAADVDSNGTVYLPEGVYLIDTAIEITDEIILVGAGEHVTFLKAGTASMTMVKQKNPGTRFYRAGMKRMSLLGEDLATIGLDLADLTYGVFEDVAVVSCTTGIKISSAANSSVYNTFFRVAVNVCTTGVLLDELSSNENRFLHCRFGSNTSRGVDMQCGSHNYLLDCGFEGNATGVYIEGDSGAGQIAISNEIISCRFESNTVTGVNVVGADSRLTKIVGGYWTGNTANVTDSGDRTIEDWNGVTSLPEVTSTPTDPLVSAQVRVYFKADKLIFMYDDAGTVRYKYLDLTGTGVTWVHTTSAP